MINQAQACCFTGHRTIAPAHKALVTKHLDQAMNRLIQGGIADFITGGARGFDTLAAQAALRAREAHPQIRLILALPCPDQTKGWPEAERAAFDSIRRRADLVYCLAEAYDSGCMMRRNRFMVDHSRLCVFYMTNPRSGTYQTVRYALSLERELWNILTDLS